MTINALHVRIHGRVQGVGYRASMKEVATRLGIQGWVRNRGDGTVEAHLVGPPQQLNALLTWCGDGSPMATVTHIQADELDEVPHYSAFSVF